jgi:MaoC like domain
MSVPAEKEARADNLEAVPLTQHDDRSRYCGWIEPIRRSACPFCHRERGPVDWSRVLMARSRLRGPETPTMKKFSDDRLYLDDLQIGQRFMSGTYVVDEDQIKAFARQFDPQPFDLDNEAAKRTLFSGLVASGWHASADDQFYYRHGAGAFRLAARRFVERSECDRNRRSARALAAGPAWRRKSEALA